MVLWTIFGENQSWCEKSIKKQKGNIFIKNGVESRNIESRNLDSLITDHWTSKICGLNPSQGNFCVSYVYNRGKHQGRSGIRTLNLRIVRQTLYPTELKGTSLHALASPVWGSCVLTTQLCSISGTIYPDLEFKLPLTPLNPSWAPKCIRGKHQGPSGIRTLNPNVVRQNTLPDN
jgi:hypothetical protein